MSLCKFLSGEETFSGFKGNSQKIRRKEQNESQRVEKEASCSRTSYFGHKLVANYSKNTSNSKAYSTSPKDIHTYPAVTG